MNETFEQAMRGQCDVLMAEARRITQCGYAVTLNGLNKDAANNSRIFGYISGALDEYVWQWCKTHKRHYIIVAVTPNKNTATGLQETYFKFRVPRIRRLAPLVAALDLIAYEVSGKAKWARPKHGVLTVEALSQGYDYRGYTNTALQTVLNLLDMDQHRALLTGGDHA